MTKVKGCDLIFIGMIDRKGLGVEKVNSKALRTLNNDEFSLICLSITEGTYIASAFNCYVVKLKPEYINNSTIIRDKYRELFTNNHYGHGIYDTEAIIDRLLPQHKKDVINAFEDGVKLLRDTMKNTEITEHAEEYYKVKFKG